VANTKSACKRIEIAERNRLRNKAYKSTVKTLMKKTLLSISNLTLENLISVSNLISLTYSKIDKAIQKGVIHANNGNSKKSFLSKVLKNKKIHLKSS
jgi:small subunit ribosomal protein S20